MVPLGKTFDPVDCYAVIANSVHISIAWPRASESPRTSACAVPVQGIVGARHRAALARMRVVFKKQNHNLFKR